MTDKEKIREEVEKIAKSINPFIPDEDGKNSDYEAGRFAMATQILQIIDSLQEEPSKFDAAIQEGDDVRYNEDLGCRVNLSQLKRVAKKEEPVRRTSADIESAMQEVEEKSKAFTEAHKGKSADEILAEMKGEEPVSDDLEEFALQYAGHHAPYDSCWQEVEDAVKAGVKWKEEQMMANATEVTVHIDAGGYPYTPEIELYDYDNDVPLAKEGDKYKVILIKE